MGFRHKSFPCFAWISFKMFSSKHVAKQTCQKGKYKIKHKDIASVISIKIEGSNQQRTSNTGKSMLPFLTYQIGEEKYFTLLFLALTET